MRIIGLLSDFGIRDSYVAQMKAVILSKCPEVELLDISHEIGKFDVRMGAFVLASATSSFPKGSIYLAVVDPDVGSKRLPLIVESERSLYVGPDNGLLMLAAIKEGLRLVYRIDDQRYLKSTVSATFHGRDLFACVVGELANDIPPAKIGTPVTDYVRVGFSKPIIDMSSIVCEVLHVDDFGNVIINVDAPILREIGVELGKMLVMRMGRRQFRLLFVRSYSEIPEGMVGCLVGGHGFLELAMRRKNLSKVIRAIPGSKLTIKL